MRFGKVFIKVKREIIFTHTKNEIIKKYKISEAFLNKSEVKKLNNDNGYYWYIPRWGLLKSS